MALPPHCYDLQLRVEAFRKCLLECHLRNAARLLKSHLSSRGCWSQSDAAQYILCGESRIKYTKRRRNDSAAQQGSNLVAGEHLDWQLGNGRHGPPMRNIRRHLFDVVAREAE
jgi:hypothetical protein